MRQIARAVLALLPPLVLLVAASLPARAAEKEIALDLGRGVRLELILVEPGTYFQGSPADEIGRADDEPEREVVISRAFYMGKVPVTRGQFARFCEASGYRTEAEKGSSGGSGWDGQKLVQRKDFTWRAPGFAQTDDHPACMVTFDDAVAFCAWLSTEARRAVVLPSEAQWEYACRAGTRTRFPSGDSDDEGLAGAWAKQNAGNGTRPAGQKSPNPWGFLDMCGNVHQWCRDWYGPYEEGPLSDPEARQSDPGQDKPRRVMRGGSWNRELKNCRAAARSRNAPGSRNADNGFRITAAPEPTKVSEAGGERTGTSSGAGAARRAGTSASAGGGAVGIHAEADTRSQEPTVGGALGSLLCCGAPLALIGYFVFQRVRAVAGGPSSRGAAVDRRGRGISFDARPSQDGFRLTVPGAAPGSTLEYRCKVHGAPQSGTVTIEPSSSGQFVYTGGPPTDIEIIALSAGASHGVTDVHDGLMRGSTLDSDHGVHRSSSFTSTSTPEPFGGYPRAY